MLTVRAVSWLGQGKNRFGSQPLPRLLRSDELPICTCQEIILRTAWAQPWQRGIVNSKTLWKHLYLRHLVWQHRKNKYGSKVLAGGRQRFQSPHQAAEMHMAERNVAWPGFLLSEHQSFLKKCSNPKGRQALKIMPRTLSQSHHCWDTAKVSWLPTRSHIFRFCNVTCVGFWKWIGWMRVWWTATLSKLWLWFGSLMITWAKKLRRFAGCPRKRMEPFSDPAPFRQKALIVVVTSPLIRMSSPKTNTRFALKERASLFTRSPSMSPRNGTLDNLLETQW